MGLKPICNQSDVQNCWCEHNNTLFLCRDLGARARGCAWCGLGVGKSNAPARRAERRAHSTQRAVLSCDARRGLCEDDNPRHGDPQGCNGLQGPAGPGLQRAARTRGAATGCRDLQGQVGTHRARASTGCRDLQGHNGLQGPAGPKWAIGTHRARASTGCRDQQGCNEMLGPMGPGPQRVAGTCRAR